MGTMRQRRLGRELRALRERAGLSHGEAIGRLGWSRAKLDRIEGGATSPKESDLRAALDLYEADLDHRTRLLELRQDAKRRGWWSAYGDVFSGSYVALEDEATLIRAWQHQVVPGLLQTQDYAREVISAGRPDMEEADVRRHVMARMARQTLLRREPDAPVLHVVLDEAILHRPIGGEAVMRPQLRHLVHEGRRDNVTIQVLPRATGTHAGLEGLFVLLRFPEPDDPDVAYAEGIYGDVYMESDAEIRRCSVAFERLCRAALSPEDSLALIGAVAEE